MKTAIVVTPEFESIWPFVADQLHRLLEPSIEVELVRPTSDEARSVAQIVSDPEQLERLIALGIGLTEADLDTLPALREVAASLGYEEPPGLAESLAARKIRRVGHDTEGFWAQSVAEFALGLTIGALRRIPQRHQALIAGQDAWQYEAQQYSDDSRFSNGTISGKRVRIVGAGNIASRYAAFTHMIGADVAAWDPYAPELAFHRSGARREHFAERLVTDAEIFAPMVPLTAGTQGLVTAELIRRLPTGCLVILATRAKIVDTEELRRRVIADELSLAADVFDLEPLPSDDALLGRANVVHTPHIAGRTRDSNHRWAEMLVEQFADYQR
ncbi:MAG TPA: NAD(P)-dependent oxidoreductase [Microlunatus sp.]